MVDVVTLLTGNWGLGNIVTSRQLCSLYAYSWTGVENNLENKSDNDENNDHCENNDNGGKIENNDHNSNSEDM